MIVVTEEQVKDNLLKLHKCAEEFTLVFSGKKTRRTNGLYWIVKQEIVINDRNFEDSEAGVNQLFYTAMHELAHHIQHTEYRATGNRCHTKLFYSILDDLAEQAEAQGLYRYDADPELRTLVDEAARINVEIAALQRQLGETLNKLTGLCLQKGVRYEDVVKRKVKLSSRAEKKLKKIAATPVPENIGFEMQEAIAAAKSEEQREAILKAAADNKSVDQAKQAASGAKADPDDLAVLSKEKNRIQKTIVQLQRRLALIVQRIEQIEQKEEGTG